MPGSNPKNDIIVEDDCGYLDAVVVPTIHDADFPAKQAVMAAEVVYAYADALHGGGSKEREAYPAKERIDIERQKTERSRGESKTSNWMKYGKHSDRRFQDVSSKNGASRNSWIRDWFVWTMAAMSLVFLSLIGYGLGSRLFLPTKTVGVNSSNPTIDLQDYRYNIVTLLDLPIVSEPTSAQARALEWLAFEDEPLFNATTLDPKDNDRYRDILSQRYALVVWYFDQGGPTVWKTPNREPSSGWIEFGAGIHECDWRGVDCDYDSSDASDGGGTVVGLRLSPALGLVLTGSSLSTELGLLTGLRRLDFSDQRLRGKIPDEWSALTNLDTIVLSKNELQSTIPEWIGGCTKLEHLALNGNLLYGTLPSSLRTLQNLKHLQLEANPRLHGRFDDVLFSSPPKNDTGTATDAGNAGPRDSLEYLDLSNTDLEGELPPVTLPALRSLRMWNTRGFRGTLPSQIGTWSNLESFSIRDSRALVGTIPTEFGLLGKLWKLEVLDSNNMEGELPTELGNLSANLRMINFRFTNQTGSLPLEWSRLTGLERIDLMQNDKLSGTVPVDYSKLTNLEFMDIRGTSLTGAVPDEVCSIGSLDEVLADCSKKGKALGKIDCACCVWCNNS